MELIERFGFRSAVLPARLLANYLVLRQLGVTNNDRATHCIHALEPLAKL